jgi:hypothetical protein
MRYEFYWNVHQMQRTTGKGGNQSSQQQAAWGWDPVKIFMLIGWSAPSNCGC